jgi:hypothetical protein
MTRSTRFCSRRKAFTWPRWRATAPEVRDYLDRFARHADADELITVHPAPTIAARLRSVELAATALSESAQSSASEFVVRP